MNVLAVQTALQSQGFDPGSLDGVWGRKTIAAVIKFQQARGLVPDGVVGPHTARALFMTASPPGVTDTLVWMDEAKRLMGTKEVSGSGSNKVILQWADNLDIHYPNDDIPWCGLFVAHCIGATLPLEALPNNPLGARNWLKFGKACEPVWGAILVFWRGSEAGWQGHVGFCAGMDNDAYHVLGGNQSNSVSIARIAKNRLLKGGALWPATSPDLPTGALVASAPVAGTLSVNEA
ncbi:TIGR02594 family protein [Roseomonas genomospecies 6]|uniref:TIGR02594 family protein n=1 Tax=Roseomonas genomospecies 6 TaxID=214106 RepID=A0A9W7NN57_9PROT|nr:TIGR02594 family protein [Roseomonas genomospecies 6]KAA0683576.1 TIGR02594 family protein [Roseomonas genomospecies 6]